MNSETPSFQQIEGASKSSSVPWVYAFKATVSFR